MTSVAIKDLDLSFGAIDVLKNLNLDVQDGEFIVLLGPSGCGKSTLLNCIAGLLDVSGGQIHIKGRNVTWEEPKDRGIGMVFQSYALYPQMTVEKNMSFGLKISGMPKAEITERVARAAKTLQIENLLKRKPAELSGGQRQRVAIGRALVRDVDVFLFDEPLSNLDAKLRSELRVEIKRLHHTLSNTMIYVTHDQIEALTLADRIAVMKGGVIQQMDDPMVIYNKPSNLFVASFLGSPAMNMMWGEIVDHGGALHFKMGAIQVPIEGYGAQTPMEPGRKVILGFRPEHVELNELASLGRPTLDGVVDLEEPMGADNLVWLKVDGNTFSVRTDPGSRYRSGDQVTLRMDMAAASIFDATTELRI